MIRQLTGQVNFAQPPVFIIDVNGVGYEVISQTIGRQVGEQATVSIYTVVREDALTLYGFQNEQERGLFVLLLSVNGIGPKSALQIIGQLGAEGLSRALNAGDPKPLQQVKGIGKKVADRLVLDLAGSIKQSNETEVGSLEIASALENLGFARREYQSILKDLPVGSLNEQLAWALQQLNAR
jgi:Holliday junction DNA helicase RuvA